VAALAARPKDFVKSLKCSFHFEMRYTFIHSNTLWSGAQAKPGAARPHHIATPYCMQ